MLIVCVVAGTGCGSADDGMPADENLNDSARRGGSSDGDAPKQPESESGNVPAVGKAAPKSDLEKIIFRAKSTIGAASTQAAENAEIMEKATAKPPAPSAAKTPAAPAKAVSDTAKKPTPALASKAAAAGTVDPTKKTAPSTAKAASPPKQETAAMTSSSYARAPVNLRVVSIIAGGKRKTAMINDGVKNHMIVVGENVTLSVGGGTKGAEVVAIQANAVIIKLDGRAAPMAIHKARKK